MNHQAIMRRLVWKDIITIKPLVLAGAICVVLFNLLALMIWHVNDGSTVDLFQASIAMWIAMPNFVALGAAAMLVGTEEDSGTMNWLRTLPVRWQQVAAAKLSVAVAAVLLTTVLSTLVFWLIYLRWEFAGIPSVSGDINVWSVLVSAFFTLLLLLLGFVATYLIRPPVMALIALVPVYGAVATLCGIFAVEFERINREAAPLYLVFAGVSVLFVSWLLQQLLARRRLLLPLESVFARAAAAIPSSSDFRPSALPVHSRPSEVVSLLWQQLRQTGPLCITLLLASTLSWIMYCGTRRHGIEFYHIFGGVAPLLIMLSASWFGAIVFYSDNVNRRCGFFADRGISPSRVWWTRMLPPSIALLLLTVAVGSVALTVGNDGWFGVGSNSLPFIAVGIVLFAFGQLVSQWSHRPILAFFAAPAYAAVSLSPAFYLMGYFHEGIESIVLVVPVLLFASWRLTSHWLEGDNDRAYTARVIGYTAVAVLMPCLWIAGHHLTQISVNMIGQALHLGVTP